MNFDFEISKVDCSCDLVAFISTCFRNNDLGPVVQSIVSLTSSLRGQLLTTLSVI